MGKKKKVVKKTKEISVALAESSSTTEVQSPRKRGRPRKIIEKNEGKEKELKNQEFQYFGGTDSKKAKTGEEDEKGEKEKKLEDIKEVVGPSSKSKKEEDKELSKLEAEAPRRSRARRKSKPRKSS